MLGRPLTLVIALMFSTAALAGCIGGPEDGDETPLAPADEQDDQPSAALPDGRGESAGIRETNRTESGSGGMEHKHDYWRGKEQVVLLDRPVVMTSTPVYPDGPGTQAKSVAYVKLTKLPDDPNRPSIVFEGSEKVSLLIDNPQTRPECEILNCYAADYSQARPDGLTPHPAPPQIFVQIRTAADSDWQEPIALTYGTPIEIAITPLQADMPHSESSLFVFRFTTDRTDTMSFDFTFTTFRGLDVLDWPGHPDFYADSLQRVVLDSHVETSMRGIDEGILYDSGGTWVHPDRLISWGTTDLVIIINITAIRNAYNADATNYFLEVHNATVIGPEITFGARYSAVEKTDDLKTFIFKVPVHPVGMDGPYQPESRWGFRAMATFANVGVPGGPGVGLCPGCFPYDIEYDIKIFAIHDPEKAAEFMNH